MKLICINNGPLINDVGRRVEAPELKEGDLYTVIKIVSGGYVLLEVDPSELRGHPGYLAERFIPISNISETEFERSFNKQTELI